MVAPSQTRELFEPLTIEFSGPKVVASFIPDPSLACAAAADIALTSTIIGPQRRIAQINGKMYSVGQGVEMRRKTTQAGACSSWLTFSLAAPC